MRRIMLVLLGLAIVSSGATADDAQTAPGRSARVEPPLSLAPAVERASPAVVNIYTSKLIRRQETSQFLEEPIMRWLFGAARPRIDVGRTFDISLGSGVIVRPDGVVVTNHHVVEGAHNIEVVLADRRTFSASLVLDDPQADLAVLKFDPQGVEMPFLEVDGLSELRVGDHVIAIGNAFGVGQTVTGGIVSALGRAAVGISNFNFFIQTDAAINPGNSGGALIDVNGRLVGINTAIFSKTGGSVGIGFAIPSSMVRAIIKAALTNQALIRPWIGATGRSLPWEIAVLLGFERPVGAFMVHVDPNGPFAAAGGQPGDVVLAVDGREIQDAEGLRFQIGTREVDSTVRLTLRRGWFSGEIEVTLVAPPDTPPPREQRLRGYHPLSGARVASLSPALAERMGLDSAVTGVVVLGVSPGSAAAVRGLRRGDIIFAINGEPISTVDDLARFIRRPYPGWRVAIRRGEEEATLGMSMVKL